MGTPENKRRKIELNLSIAKWFVPILFVDSIIHIYRQVLPSGYKVWLLFDTALYISFDNCVLAYIISHALSCVISGGGVARKPGGSKKDAHHLRRAWPHTLVLFLR